MKSIGLLLAILIAAGLPAFSSDLSQAETADTPTLKSGTAQNSFSLGAEEKYLAWERWHHRVGKAFSKKFKKATRLSLGAATVRITIRKDHDLKAELLSCSNERFGSRCVEEALTLSGDPVLEFPTETHRELIVLTFQFRRGIFIFPKDEFTKDDFERVSKD